jgi:hypothetical protein
MAEERRTAEINISDIPVTGVGGLGLVAIAAVMAYTLPQTWLPLGAGVAGGVLIAVAVILARRRRPLP